MISISLVATRVGRRGWRFALVLALLTLVATSVSSRTAQAHPLDQYPQLAYVTVTPTQVEVDLVLTPGVLLAPAVLDGMDLNGDGTVSDAEQQAYVTGIVGAQTLTVDGQALALTMTSLDFPAELNIQAGYGEIRIDLAAILPAGTTSGRHEIVYTNGFAPAGSVYQVNAFADGDAVSLEPQDRTDSQQSLTVTYSIDVASPANGGDATVAETDSSTSGRAQRLLNFLAEPSRSPVALLLTLGLAMALGALHALTPGHGKSLAAAYLVGSRGTIRHAAALGGIVTLTHTASVIVIGLVALFASQYIVPEILVPSLEVTAGLLVVVLGARLISQRWGVFHRQRAYRRLMDRLGRGTRADAAIAGGGTPPGGAPVTLAHDHGDGRMHTHLPPERVTTGSLLTLGISGGIVPCPEALGIMIVAVGLNHVLVGLGLIVTFSFGLAAMLIVIGIVLVRSRSLVERAGQRSGWIGRGFGPLIPVISAALITVLGLVIVLRGVATYLG